VRLHCLMLMDLFFALRDFCPHLGYSLASGELTDKVIRCPLHNALFDVTTGALLRGPSKSPATTYPIKVEGEDVFVGLTDIQLERGF